jgi:hypothetical protein
MCEKIRMATPEQPKIGQLLHVVGVRLAILEFYQDFQKATILQLISPKK